MTHRPLIIMTMIVNPHHSGAESRMYSSTPVINDPHDHDRIKCRHRRDERLKTIDPPAHSSVDDTIGCANHHHNQSNTSDNMSCLAYRLTYHSDTCLSFLMLTITPGLTILDRHARLVIHIRAGFTDKIHHDLSRRMKMMPSKTLRKTRAHTPIVSMRSRLLFTIATVACQIAACPRSR